ncbi:sulfotransferase 1C2A [Lingula anatina]|uniref:Sulfotransferase 1C2A n=1 Tax=Lingula anatina TaxID=7574 RepID=A0A1S3HJT8_LINAN|nr:sulfotransferase 1C2A [Lingula anatina]XP_013386390.1 sulfotransferase 1C2A [Lingula anatina]|eukprot:XP_013386383.1 sulfotransferase 1C2A [Lingula anatina]
MGLLRMLYTIFADIYWFPWVMTDFKNMLYRYWQGKLPKSYEFTDCEGNTVSLTEFNGVTFDRSFLGLQDAVENPNHFQAREDDIWVVNWPKSGTHWLWEIIMMLTSDKPQLSSRVKEECMFELRPDNALDAMPSPRVLDTHVPYQFFPKQALSKSKVLYSVRHPKDAAVSLYYHMRNIEDYSYLGTWNGFFSLFMENKVECGSWFDHVEGWLEIIENHSNVQLVKFEDLKEDLTREIKRVAEFIGYPKSDEFYAEVAKQCSFENMKKNKTDMLSGWRPKSDGMYRKGKVGGWKGVFTVQQNEIFNSEYEKRAKNFKIDLGYRV